MIGNIGPLEIGIVLVVAILVFGPKRLPELGRSAGKSIREFKHSVGEVTSNAEETPARVSAAALPVETPGSANSAAAEIANR